MVISYWDERPSPSVWRMRRCGECKPTPGVPSLCFLNLKHGGGTHLKHSCLFEAHIPWGVATHPPTSSRPPASPHLPRTKGCRGIHALHRLSNIHQSPPPTLILSLACLLRIASLVPFIQEDLLCRIRAAQLIVYYPKSFFFALAIS